MNPKACAADLFKVVDRLGFVATYFEDHAREKKVIAELVRLATERPGEFRLPNSAVAYLQAPTGFRQRVRLDVMVRTNHPAANQLDFTLEEEAEAKKGNYTLVKATTPKRSNLEADGAGAIERMVREGVAVVVERPVLDHPWPPSLSRCFVGPTGIDRIESQSLRVLDMLATWLMMVHTSPRGFPSPVREWALPSDGASEETVETSSPMLRQPPMRSRPPTFLAS